MSTTIRYVLGFAFTDEFVLLVKKKHGPGINLEKWNGVGGKVDPGEDSLTAMTREFQEETGCSSKWEKFGTFLGDGWEIDLFRGEFEGNEVPDCNDVGEPLQFEEVASVLNPSYEMHYAQNVPTMVAQAALGKGIIRLTVEN